MGGGYALSKFGVPPDGGGNMRVTALCNKESAMRRTLPASLGRDAFRRFLLPLLLPDGEGLALLFYSDI